MEAPAYVKWKETSIFSERGTKQLRYYLKRKDGNLDLVVVGTMKQSLVPKLFIGWILLFQVDVLIWEASKKNFNGSLGCWTICTYELMSYSRRSRYSRSPSPYRRYKRSVSRSTSLSSTRSRSYDSNEVENPGNNLYVTGLSPRITKRDIEKHFSTEGKVEDVHLVVDPWSRESRRFGVVTMSTVEEAERCIKYLDRSVLEGRVIMVEKGSPGG